MFSGVPRQQRDARHHFGDHALDHLVRRLADIGGDHLGAVDHDVGDREVAQIEQAAEHVAIVFLDAALTMEEVDRTAQALVRRQAAARFRRP